MKAPRKSVTTRTADGLRRQAYELEYLAKRLRADGFDDEAAGVLKTSSTLGDIGRRLAEKLESRQ